MKQPRKLTRATKVQAAKAAKKGVPMPKKTLAAELSALAEATPEEQNQALHAVAQAKGISVPSSGFDWSSLLQLLPIILAMLKASSGGGSGPSGTLPVPDIPAPPVPPAGPLPTPPTPGPTTPPDAPTGQGRAFVGLTGKYGNFQHGPLVGKPGRVKPDEARGKEVFDDGANIDAVNEKSKFIFYLSPLMSDGQALKPGDPENAEIKVDWYGIVFDGELAKGDAIGDLDGVEVNNNESSNGMNPRIVVGGLSGNHTIAGAASVNGHEFTGKTLFVNRH